MPGESSPEKGQGEKLAGVTPTGRGGVRRAAPPAAKVRAELVTGLVVLGGDGKEEGDLVPGIEA